MWAIGEDEVYVLVSTKPRLTTWLAERWEGWLWEEICAKSNDKLEGLRVKELQQTYRKGGGSTRRVMLQLLAGQVYTKQEACRMGADCKSDCALCNGVTYTIQHRLSGCIRGPQVSDAKVHRYCKEVIFKAHTWP